MTRADIAAYMAQQSRHGVLLVDMSSADISRAIEAVAAPPVRNARTPLALAWPRMAPPGGIRAGRLNSLPTARATLALAP